MRGARWPNGFPEGRGPKHWVKRWASTAHQRPVCGRERDGFTVRHDLWGAGGTIGPAMVFGFLAGRHAAAM